MEFSNSHFTKICEMITSLSHDQPEIREKRTFMLVFMNFFKDLFVLTGNALSAVMIVQIDNLRDKKKYY